MTDKIMIGMVNDIPTLETIVSQRQQAVDASEPKEFDTELFRGYIRLSNMYFKELNGEKARANLRQAVQHYSILSHSKEDRKGKRFYHTMLTGMADILDYKLEIF